MILWRPSEHDDRPDLLKVVDLGLTDFEVTDLDPTSSKLFFFWLGGRR